ncbi:MAG TPA: FeoB-associated Cys-rich membrane protein [Ruminiclostridium sp.]|nr:FeoB-associated Cys-rich membrane protein [Ruminiclostridium sp.]
MVEFLKGNIATILISVLVFGLMAWVVIYKIRQRRKGISGCGCGCSGCPEANKCHK